MSSSPKFGLKKKKKSRKGERLLQHVCWAVECTAEMNPWFVPTYHTPVHITERSLNERTGFLSD